MNNGLRAGKVDLGPCELRRWVYANLNCRLCVYHLLDILWDLTQACCLPHLVADRCEILCQVKSIREPFISIEEFSTTGHHLE